MDFPFIRSKPLIFLHKTKLTDKNKEHLDRQTDKQYKVQI